MRRAGGEDDLSAAVRSRPISGRRPLHLAVALFVVLVLLPACKVEVGALTSVSWDGSGSVALTLRPDGDVREALGQAGLVAVADALFDAKSAGADDPFAGLKAAGWKVTPLGEGAGVRIEHPFRSPDEVEALFAQLGGPSATSLFPQASLKLSKGLWQNTIRFRGTVDAAPDRLLALVTTGLASPPNVSEIERVLGRPLSDVVTIGYGVDIPDVTKVAAVSDGAKKTGPSSWELRPGQRLEVQVDGAATNPAYWAALFFGVLLVLSLLAVGTGWVLTRRHRPTPTPTPTRTGPIPPMPAAVPAAPEVPPAVSSVPVAASSVLVVGPADAVPVPVGQVTDPAQPQVGAEPPRPTEVPAADVVPRVAGGRRKGPRRRSSIEAAVPTLPVAPPPEDLPEAVVAAPSESKRRRRSSSQRQTEHWEPVLERPNQVRVIDGEQVEAEVAPGAASAPAPASAPAEPADSAGAVPPSPSPSPSPSPGVVRVTSLPPLPPPDLPPPPVPKRPGG